MSHATLLELEDKGLSQLLCLRDVNDKMISGHTQCVKTVHKFQLLKKFPAVAVFYAETHATDRNDSTIPYSDTSKTDVLELHLNSQHSAPLTSYTSDQQPSADDCNHSSSTCQPVSSLYFF